MNICLVTTEYPPEKQNGGIGTYTFELAQKLAKDNNVYVITISNKETSIENDGNLTVCRIKENFINKKLQFSFFRGITLYKTLRKLNKEHKIDVVEVPEYEGNGWLIVKKFPKTVIRLHCPVFITSKINGDNMKGLKKIKINLMEKLECYTIAKSKYISAPSYSIIEEVGKRVPLKDKKINVIPNGINISQAIKPSTLVNYNKNIIKVLFVGRLTKGKGADLLIKAINYLYEIKELNRFEFTMVGKEGSYKDMKFKKYISKEVNKEIFRYIKFTDDIPRNEVNKLYRSTDIVIIPSMYESFSYVMIEAMYNKSIIISSGKGAMKEIIESTDGNYIFKENDFIDIAKILLHIEKNFEKFGNVCDKNKVLVEKNYNLEKLSYTYVDMYKRISLR